MPAPNILLRIKNRMLRSKDQSLTIFRFHFKSKTRSATSYITQSVAIAIEI